MPDFAPSPNKQDTPKAYVQSQSPSQFSSHGHPISPPRTRSASAEDNAASLVEDWRMYTEKLRTQHEGERAHMLADRKRMQEVMEEERTLWDKERDILKAQIAELEAQLRSNRAGNDYISASTGSSRSRILSPSGTHSSRVLSPSLNIPQESGRDEDGNPFYAPAPQNPSRTFSPSVEQDLSIDDISGKDDRAIIVPSKVLTSSDFGLQSPDEPPSVPENPAESIDISLIQPELEGVPIRTSAVAPQFVAKVLSPQNALSPIKSPNLHPRGHLDRSVSAPQPRIPALEIIKQPENRRLTMHAGHTPNHSISKLDFLSESGNATPTQKQIDQQHQEQLEKQAEQQHEQQGLIEPVATVATGHEQLDEIDNGDVPLKGQLGLTNNGATDDVFLTQLVKKLAEEARKSEGTSPDESALSSTEEDEKEDDDGMPILKLKQSFNFGRPMGEV
ncbi:hypothetical protein F5884DRAFT_666503 [Xylogone sp. PMI_703]|nr:hypothetical protein F5884DRAFT_666503 [Xylogone sp. PMI_703]